jgi:hypothetical protein
MKLVITNQSINGIRTVPTAQELINRTPSGNIHKTAESRLKALKRKLNSNGGEL